ncbi:MAG TPA: anthranilate synthase component I family protein, partial [Naasia sp.]
MPSIAPPTPAAARRVRLDGWVDPEAAFLALFPSGDAFWLDSGVGATAGRSWLGGAAGPPLLAEDGDPGEVLARLDAELAAFRAPSSGDGFALGWVGWLGYEAGARLVGAPSAESPLPDAAWLRVDRAVAFDHGERAVTLLVGAEAADGDDWLRRTADALDALRDAPPPPPPGPVTPGRQAQLRHDRSRYRALVELCRAAIREGDAYQLCLTNQIAVPGALDPVEAYRRLRRGNPSHHGGFLRIGETSLLSSSPEVFLAADPDGHVSTSPIKGTRPRSADPDLDARLAHELVASDKERAENLMIVDLMRNDLSRVAESGSVVVDRLFEVQSYANVHQLVSTVTGRLKPGLSPLDAVRACFPAGSMTGAPKRSAMTILDALEDGPRGVYSGAFGYLGRDARLDLAMTIRSIVVGPDGATIGSGGGITALSDPDAEVEEML